MKYRLLSAFALFFSTAVFAATSTPAQPQSPPQQKQSLIKPEVDKTDIYAIPVDTSEVEEKQEESSLQRLQKYEQAKKAKEKEASTQSK